MRVTLSLFRQASILVVTCLVGPYPFDLFAQEDAATQLVPITQVEFVLDKSPVIMRVRYHTETDSDRLAIDLPPGVTSFPENLMVTSAATWQATIVQPNVTASKGPAIQPEVLNQLREDLQGKEVEIDLEEGSPKISGQVKSLDAQRIVVKSNKEKGVSEVLKTSQVVRIKTANTRAASSHRLVLTRKSDQKFVAVTVTYTLEATDVGSWFEVRWANIGDLPRPSLAAVDTIKNITATPWTKGTKVVVVDGNVTRSHECRDNIDPQETVRVVFSLDELMLSQSIQIPVSDSKTQFLGDATWRVTVDAALPSREVRIPDLGGTIRHTSQISLNPTKTASVIEYPYDKNLDKGLLDYKITKLVETRVIAAIHGLWVEECKAIGSIVNFAVRRIKVSLKPQDGYSLFIEGQVSETELPSSSAADSHRIHLLAKSASRSNLRNRSADQVSELTAIARTRDHRVFLEQLAELMNEVQETRNRIERNLDAVAPDAGLLLPQIETTPEQRRMDILQQRLQAIEQSISPKDTQACDPELLKDLSKRRLSELERLMACSTRDGDVWDLRQYRNCRRSRIAWGFPRPSPRQMVDLRRIPARAQQVHQIAHSTVESSRCP